jgi:2-polyprenyl-3-methyl-5-hydroxy-6-metoxy-1,4-benzoquinol methylase
MNKILDMEPSPAEIQHWDTWNSKFRQPETIDDEPSKRRMREVLAWLTKLNIQNANLLEVGCGTGWLSTKLTEFGKVTGVDLGREIIETAKLRHLNIDFRSGDIHVLDLPAHSFDVIVTLETFSHVPDQPTFVRRLSELLKPGGLLLLTTQNKSVFERREGVPPNVGYIRNWVTMHTLKSILGPEFVIQQATTLEPAGRLGMLRIVNSRTVNHWFEMVLGAPRVKRLKERAGFGQTLFVVARKR